MNWCAVTVECRDEPGEPAGGEGMERGQRGKEPLPHFPHVRLGGRGQKNDTVATRNSSQGQNFIFKLQGPGAWYYGLVHDPKKGRN